MDGYEHLAIRGTSYRFHCWAMGHDKHYQSVPRKSAGGAHMIKSVRPIFFLDPRTAVEHVLHESLAGLASTSNVSRRSIV